MHDIVGHYNRFDIFRLSVDRRPRTLIDFGPSPEAEDGPKDGDESSGSVRRKTQGDA